MSECKKDHRIELAKVMSEWKPGDDLILFYAPGGLFEKIVKGGDEEQEEFNTSVEKQRESGMIATTCISDAALLNALSSLMLSRGIPAKALELVMEMQVDYYKGIARKKDIEQQADTAVDDLIKSTLKNP